MASGAAIRAAPGRAKPAASTVTARVALIVAAVVVACTPPISPPVSQGSNVSPSAAASEGAASPAARPSAASVRLQLHWLPQAQFAGYFAADRQGDYAAEGLTVTIVRGGPNVVPERAGSAVDGPEFTIGWVPTVLEARESGSDLVDVAQVFQRSGAVLLTWTADGLTNPCALAGKKIGVREAADDEVTAGLLTCGLTSGLELNGDASKQYELVVVPSGVKALLAHEVSASEAMVYDGYGQILEAADPATGKLFQPNQLTVMDWNAYRVATLQDAIFARKSWLDQGTNTDIAVRFIRASLKGWIYCRDHPDECIQYTTAAGSELGAGHQRWMMNEVNALVWPSPTRIGMIDPVLWGQTVEVAKGGGVIRNDPSTDAYRTDLVTQALAGITQDAKGSGFTKSAIQVTPGGS